MTTVLADAKLGVMCSDSNFTDDDRLWPQRKVFRIKGSLVGVAGTVANWRAGLEWLRQNGARPQLRAEHQFGLLARGKRAADHRGLQRALGRVDAPSSASDIVRLPTTCGRSFMTPVGGQRGAICHRLLIGSRDRGRPPTALEALPIDAVARVAHDDPAAVRPTAPEFSQAFGHRIILFSVQRGIGSGS